MKNRYFIRFSLLLLGLLSFLSEARAEKIFRTTCELRCGKAQITVAPSAEIPLKSLQGCNKPYLFNLTEDQSMGVFRAAIHHTSEVDKEGKPQVALFKTARLDGKSRIDFDDTTGISLHCSSHEEEKNARSKLSLLCQASCGDKTETIAFNDGIDLGKFEGCDAKYLKITAKEESVFRVPMVRVIDSRETSLKKALVYGTFSDKLENMPEVYFMHGDASLQCRYQDPKKPEWSVLKAAQVVAAAVPHGEKASLSSAKSLEEGSKGSIADAIRASRELASGAEARDGAPVGEKKK
ncbi:MAG: hypothetical protein AB1540_04180 [Bdellovibrionota bacterium]